MGLDLHNAPHIALIGYMGAGKTAIRNELTQLGYQHLSFATPLKEIFINLIGRPIDKKVDRPAIQALGDGARNPLYRWVGYWYIPRIIRAKFLHDLLWPEDPNYSRLSILIEEFFKKGYDKDFGRENYWVIKLKKSFITQLRDSNGQARFVVDDARYLNEARALKDLGFTLVRVDVPLNVVKQRLTQRDGGFKEEWFEHRSEKEHLQIQEDIKIDNTGPLEAALEELLRQL